ncbi:recombinase [Actinomadura darangshiensis]|uniref:Recombinase n=1 Tax=Actinomadura darangshiensis TaxID=705336 RepID=A0A4R4ZZ71_9ACTN|nr:recombinase [Actinomadura darangshiensis]
MTKCGWSTRGRPPRPQKRAIAEGWIGEIEGIDLTLRFLTDKRLEAQRLLRLTSQVALLMPTIRADT